jgi:hypothetical protein
VTQHQSMPHPSLAAVLAHANAAVPGVGCWLVLAGRGWAGALLIALQVACLVASAAGSRLRVPNRRKRPANIQGSAC